MILEKDIIEAGKFNKPHGINGEISVTMYEYIDLNDVKCIIMSIDGIFVPFFIKSVRVRNAETFLITIDGIDSEIKAQSFTNQPFYILQSDMPEIDEGEEEGFYLNDLVGYGVSDSNLGYIGRVTDVNDQTENILLIIEREDGDEVYVPAVEEFITDINPETQLISTTLPKGMIELNN
ncbi:MAG: ribosome maturation factor RimM [Muribaculum sp.]|nr:ribosome maturation factor RimM [Muribaculum sp.]